MKNFSNFITELHKLQIKIIEVPNKVRPVIKARHLSLKHYSRHETKIKTLLEKALHEFSLFPDHSQLFHIKSFEREKRLFKSMRNAWNECHEEHITDSIHSVDFELKLLGLFWAKGYEKAQFTDKFFADLLKIITIRENALLEFEKRALIIINK